MVPKEAMAASPLSPTASREVKSARLTSEIPSSLLVALVPLVLVSVGTGRVVDVIRLLMPSPYAGQFRQLRKFPKFIARQ